jgi:Arc/MetJ-type ribon-helix-helix transcriptional regulator
MKRITVSLPDELVDRIKRVAGEGQVSSYVARAITEYQHRETLDQILADWEAETPTTEDIRRQVEAEFDRIGLVSPSDQDHRMAG